MLVAWQNYLKLFKGALEKIDGHQYELVVKNQNGGKSLGEFNAQSY